jgi:hypothetical protein
MCCRILIGVGSGVNRGRVGLAIRQGELSIYLGPVLRRPGRHLEAGRN